VLQVMKAYFGKNKSGVPIKVKPVAN
jgi:hypothetical protein